MDQRMMVKQRMGEIPANEKHPRFEVFTTGMPGWYLFCPMQSIGNLNISGTIQIPVQGRDLVRGWRRLLE